MMTFETDFDNAHKIHLVFKKGYEYAGYYTGGDDVYKKEIIQVTFKVDKYIEMPLLQFFSDSTYNETILKTIKWCPMFVEYAMKFGGRKVCKWLDNNIKDDFLQQIIQTYYLSDMQWDWLKHSYITGTFNDNYSISDLKVITSDDEPKKPENNKFVMPLDTYILVSDNLLKIEFNQFDDWQIDAIKKRSNNVLYSDIFGGK